LIDADVRIVCGEVKGKEKRKLREGPMKMETQSVNWPLRKATIRVLLVVSNEPLAAVGSSAKQRLGSY